MKFALSLLLAVFALNAKADPTSTEKASDLVCADEGLKSLIAQKHFDAKNVSFFNGAMVADGAYTIEIDVFQVKGDVGLYKVELDADGCVFRNLEYLN